MTGYWIIWRRKGSSPAEPFPFKKYLKLIFFFPILVFPECLKQNEKIIPIVLHRRYVDEPVFVLIRKCPHLVYGTLLFVLWHCERRLKRAQNSYLWKRWLDWGSAVQAVLTVSLEWGGMHFNWVGWARFVLAGVPFNLCCKTAVIINKVCHGYATANIHIHRQIYAVIHCITK